jgi:hypothetical protein
MHILFDNELLEYNRIYRTGTAPNTDDATKTDVVVFGNFAHIPNDEALVVGTYDTKEQAKGFIAQVGAKLIELDIAVIDARSSTLTQD